MIWGSKCGIWFSSILCIPLILRKEAVNGCVWAGQWQPVLAGAHALLSQPASYSDLWWHSQEQRDTEPGLRTRNRLFRAEVKIPALLSSHVPFPNTCAGRTIPYLREPWVVSFCPLQPCDIPRQTISPVFHPLALTHFRGSATTTWEFMSKAAALEEQGVFCSCTSEPCWPLERVIALSIIRIILSGLGPRLNNQFNPWTSCWN